MKQPEAHHLAELNFGTLRHDWDDPRVNSFIDGFDLVYGIAERSAGYVWRLTDDQMADVQGEYEAAFGNNPRIALALSVWQDAASLEHFVWNTVHRQFYARKAEWYDAVGNGNLVMWWVPVGHKPTLAEGMARWRQFDAQDDSDQAFGWKYLKDAVLWRSHGCAQVGAE